MGAADHCYRPRTPMAVDRVRDKTDEAPRRSSR